MKTWVWISFDLGVSGDYEGMYTWLDNHGAKECGDNVAFLKYEPQGDLVEALKKSLKNSVDLTKKSRVYVIYRTEGSRLRGVFLFGKRRRAPWTGYGAAEEQESADEL